MGYIFDDWKDLLDEFQKCVDKDLAEIQKQKAEVQQMKEGLFNSFGGGLLYRDGNRIVISAPEIVIGNVDRTGTLQGGGVGKVIIRGSEVDIEGVGSTGSIVSRAPIIRQVAVDPGIDGRENVVCNTSRIVSQACDIVLHSSDTTEVFSQDPGMAGRGGVTIHADTNLNIEAAVSADKRKEDIENKVSALGDMSSDLKTQMKAQKKTVDNLFDQLSTLFDNEDENNQSEDFKLRSNVKDVMNTHDQIEAIQPAIYDAVKTYLGLVSELAEVNRQKTALETQKDAITTGDDFKNNTTGAKLTLNAESISIANIDGEGNLHTNDEAGIILRTPKMGISMMDDTGKLVEGSSFGVGAENISLVTRNVSDDGKEFPTVGQVYIDSKNITFEAVDYKLDDNSLTIEKELTADGSIQLRAKTVEVSTSNPKDLTYDTDGNLTSGEYTAEGDVIFKTKNLTVDCLDYEVSDGELKMKAQTADSTVSVRAEKTNFLSADAEGKATGSFTANAKTVTIKSMDVDKDSLADSALAAGSTMVLLSEKMYAGAKSKDVKSKKVQVVSEEIGVFADNTFEAQQGEAKAVVQLDGGKTSLGGDKTQIYGDTTIEAKTEIKDELKAPKATIDHVEAKSSFKSPNIKDGASAGGGGGGGSLSAKLTLEDAPADDTSAETE
jgi:hypothetical protein